MLLSRYLILGTDGHGANTGNVSRMTDQEVLDLDLPGRRGAGLSIPSLFGSNDWIGARTTVDLKLSNNRKGYPAVDNISIAVTALFIGLATSTNTVKSLPSVHRMTRYYCVRCRIRYASYKR
jgi:hypothetical protein